VRALELTGDVLEFGTGTGTLITRLTRQGFEARMTGADILPRPAGLSDGVRWIQADLHGRRIRAEVDSDALAARERRPAGGAALQRQRAHRDREDVNTGHGSQRDSTLRGLPRNVTPARSS
jgi:hypothetical protein